MAFWHDYTERDQAIFGFFASVPGFALVMRFGNYAHQPTSTLLTLFGIFCSIGVVVGGMGLVLCWGARLLGKESFSDVGKKRLLPGVRLAIILASLGVTSLILFVPLAQ